MKTIKYVELVNIGSYFTKIFAKNFISFIEYMKCWVCGSNKNKFLGGKEFKKNLVPSDVAITNDQYGKTLPLYECLNCSFIYAYPLPDNILSLYENLEDEVYIDSLSPRFKEMKHLMKMATNFHPNAKNILDVGAGVGLMVKAAVEMKLDATGVEPSKWLVNQAKKIFNINLIEGIVPSKELEGKKFDIVFAVDVIEHLSEPVEFLNTLKNYLNDDGIIFIATPDSNSFLAKKLGRKWWHYRLAHIGYFNHKSMKEAVSKANLKIEKFDRQNWYLPLGYLSVRLSNYLPVNFFVNFLKKFPKVENTTIRLNLHDNLVVILRKNN
ncbi:MAG: class I SAM-dependent methyltransferase [Bacteroidota bacterium]|nr:class I SAM-dependent methyltransferase [Bacteroidota bacterium]